MRAVRITLIIALGAAAIVSARALASDPLSEAEEALKDRDYAKAVELFKKAFDQAKEGRDTILYLQATALQGAGQYNEAIALCDRIVKEFPESSWVLKAQWKKGDLLAFRKENELAAKLTEERIKSVTAPERRKAIAMIYVGAAREFLDPKEKGDPSFVPNYVAAQKLFVKALELEALGTDEEAVRIQVLDCEWKANFDRHLVLKTIKEFREKFPKSPRMDEVALTEGRALAVLGRRWEAKKAWATIPETSKLLPQALFETAALYEARNVKEYGRLRDVLKRIVDKFPDAEIAPQAAMLLAETTAAYSDLRSEAIDAFRAVALRYSKDERAPTALIRMAELHAADENLDGAIAAYEGFLKSYPENSRWGEVRQRIADLRFRRAQIAYLRKDHLEAVKLWDEFLQAYPTDPNAVQVGVLKGDSLRDRKQWPEAVEQYRRAAQRFAGTAEAALCRFRAGEILEKEIGDFEGALKEFGLAGSPPAKDRIAEIRGKSHSIASGRVFTTAEAAAVTLTSRNIQKVQFRLWALDLKDYFEKKASVANLHAIEVGIIAPDQEWEVEIKEYAKYKEIKKSVPIPVKGAGAYIVTAREENRESTTVLVVSDLSFIAKAGRHGVTLFGQDNRKNLPLDSIPFRVAADGKIVHDGKSFPKEVTPNRISILADVLGNFAFRDMDLSAIQRRPARTPLALVAPDRWIYAEAETVHLRIVVRDVVDNTYVIPKDKTYKLTAVSTHGVTLLERDLKLTPLGTAFEKLDLPAGAAGVGFTVTEGRTIVGQASVIVGPVMPRSMRIEFESDDKTWFLGDVLDVRINLRSASGRPIPSKKFKVHLNGWAEWKDLTTDENGGVTLHVDDTEQFDRVGAVEISVQADGVQDFRRIPLLPRGFGIEIDPTSRLLETVFAGEAKTIVFFTRDAAKQPVSKKLSWEVRRVDEAGLHVLIASGEVTPGQDGKGTFAFTPQAGGVHEVHLRGRDDDNLPVGASTALLVSDDKDETKLRILADKDEIGAGEPLNFTVHSRLDRGLAYVTVEGEQVEIVKSLTLEKDKNAVSLDLAGKSLRLARVSVMMMQGNKFYHATRDFKINRAPEPTIEFDKKDYRPGDEVRMTVKTKAPSELYVVVAEHVLTNLDADRIDPLLPGPFFATDSSNAQGFEGVTTQVSKQLEDALARLDNLEGAGVRVMMEKPNKDGDFDKARKQFKQEEKGEGQGYGGRFGGRENLTTRGGGKRFLPENYAQPKPLLVSVIPAGGTLTFRLPLENGTYTVAVFASDGTNAIGKKSQELKVRGDVTSEVEPISAARVGDKLSAVVYLTNHTGSATKQTVYFVAGKEKKQSDVEIPARSVKVAAFPFEVTDVGTTKVTVGGRELTVDVRPKGAEHVLSAGGTSLTLEAPGDATGLRLWVDVAGSTEAQLRRLEAADSPSFTASADQATALIAHAARLRYLQEIKAAANVPELQASLLRWQSWRSGKGTGIDGQSDIPTEVLSALAISEAKLAGLEVKPATDALKALFSQTPYDEQKALLLFAMSRSGDANFAYVNRLSRNPEALSARAAAIVAILLHAAGKNDEAKALLAKVTKWEPAKQNYLDWSNTPATTVAFVALAYAEIDPANEQAGKAMDWLLAHPPASAFERGITAMALARTFAVKKTPNTPAAVTLKVNGKEAKPGAIDPALLVKGPQKIEVTGGHAVATLRYLTGKAREETFKVAVKRTIHWPALEVDGQTLALGLQVSADDKTNNPSMKKTRAGSIFTATYEFTFGPSDAKYFVLEESIPAGVRVIGASGLAGARIEEGRLWLLLAKANPAEVKATVTLTLSAASAGTFHAAPLAIYSLGDPDPIAHVAAGDDFEVVEKDGREGYTFTHGELYQLGRLAYEKKEWKKSKEHLARLFDQATLLPNYYVETARMLTYASLELGENDATVRYFEVLKEKLPTEVVPFDKILAIGRAYGAIKEFERARQVYIGASDAYFLQETYVVGVLQDLGRTKPAEEQMTALLLAYPDSDLNRQMLFGHGQDLLNRGKATLLAEKDPLKLSRKELLTRAAEVMERYLALHPADAACDQVSLVLGSTYLEGGEDAKAEASGRASARRYPKSKYLDSFDYVQAYALFAQKKFADALTICAKLETFDYGKQANPGPAIMKDLATLMKAQIYHAKGEIDKALEAYKIVREKYPDAARAISFLEREAISMPEVTVTPTTKPSEIEVEYSGVPDIRVKAYKVNLTMLFLKYKGVTDASAVEVAGIRPAFEKAYALEKPNAKRKEKQKLALDLKETGAYFVSVKAGDFFATGLFLKSDLTMTVQEEVQTGTVRVNVANSASGKFEENVKVTFVGSADSAFKSEKTDLRGITEASGLHGMAMVIAEKDAHYAFYRGQAPLSAVQPQEQRRAQEKNAQDALEEDLKKLDENLDRYRGNNRNEQKGVEIERTKKK